MSLNDLLFKLISGPTILRNMLGPGNNIYLDRY